MNADEQDFMLWHFFSSGLILPQTPDSAQSSFSGAWTISVDPSETQDQFERSPADI
jgi:hypothetical protein